MFIPIETSSGIPIYRQISNGIRFYIASGKLRAGEKVPSVRDLCSALKVNPATVNKAYRELELDGYLETRRGLGTYVADEPPKPSIAQAEEILEEKIRELIVDAARLGLSVPQLVQVLKRNSEALKRLSVEK